MQTRVHSKSGYWKSNFIIIVSFVVFIPSKIHLKHGLEIVDRWHKLSCPLRLSLAAKLFKKIRLFCQYFVLQFSIGSYFCHWTTVTDCLHRCLMNIHVFSELCWKCPTFGNGIFYHLCPTINFTELMLISLLLSHAHARTHTHMHAFILDLGGCSIFLDPMVLLLCSMS